MLYVTGHFDVWLLWGGCSSAQQQQQLEQHAQFEQQQQLELSGGETPIMLDGQWRCMYITCGDLPLQKTIFCLETLRSRLLVHGSSAVRRGLRLIDTSRRGAPEI